MTQQSLITRLKAVGKALAKECEYQHANYSEPNEDLDAALSDLREVIKEAEGQEPTMIRVLGEDGWQANAKLIPHYTALGEKP